MLNAGHRNGAVAGRCVVRGKIVETEELPAYSLALRPKGEHKQMAKASVRFATRSMRTWVCADTRGVVDPRRRGDDGTGGLAPCHRRPLDPVGARQPCLADRAGPRDSFQDRRR